ncbi:MAG: 50S ribosomal protein L4 [Patescibacteria group bacterium]
MADIKVKLYNWKGETVGEEDLDVKVFGTNVKAAVVQQAVVAQRANARQVLAHVKDRSEVRGGGKKPWQQKGTGRARHGSIRSPLWVGGGVTFGPNANRNFSQKINKKTKALALQMVLSDKAKHNHLIVVEDYNFTDAKTKVLVAGIAKLPVAKKSVLIVTETAKDKIVLAAKNLSKIQTIHYGSLNVVDLLKNEYLLVSKKLLAKITEHYS